MNRNFETLQRLNKIESCLGNEIPTVCPACVGHPDVVEDCGECLGLGQIQYTYSGDADKDLPWLVAELRQRIPVGLPQTLEQLFQGFGQALLEKALRAREKYGFPEDGWRQEGWQATLAKELLEHVHKGDPRDVAVYAAFAWYHGWSITPAAPYGQPNAAGQNEAAADNGFAS